MRHQKNQDRKEELTPQKLADGSGVWVPESWRLSSVWVTSEGDFGHLWLLRGWRHFLATD